MSFASQKTDAINFPAEETTFTFFGVGELGRSSVFWPLQSEKMVQKNWLGLDQK